MSAVRTPRFQVIINGTALPDGVVKGCEIEASGNLQAGTFNFEAALYASSNYGFSFWDNASNSKFETEIRISVDAKSYVSMIFGEADDVEISPERGVVRVSGRDMTKKLIDADESSVTYQNMSPSQIIKSIAGNSGLSVSMPDDISPTGRFFQNEFTKVNQIQNSSDATPWDTLSTIGNDLGFIPIIKGRTLTFKKKPAMALPSFSAFWRENGRVSNVMNLELQKSMTIARGVAVTTASYDSRAGKTVTKRYGKKSAVSNYKFVKPNMQEDQADDFCKNMYDKASSHEKYITFGMPGELNLTPHDAVELTGDVGSWAQSYIIDSISRRINMESGYSQTIHAKNGSPSAAIDDQDDENV